MRSDVKELGVGLICFPGHETVVQSLSGLIDVVEIEPQTSWFKQSEGDSFRFDPHFTATLAAMPQPKIFHGVGFPIGATILPPRGHFDTLNAHIDALDPAYTSEHLSFNRYCDIDGNISQANFLLPPLQNDHGVQTAVRAIEHYKRQTGLPFAFETGTNYLRPRKGEMDDGEFVAQIAEHSDTYILLDLHNLLANERNGRQPLKEFIRQLPLERVIEIHLANGFYHKDYYLDAHSGASSDELLDLTRDIVRQLPCLKSMIFEMLPDYYRSGQTEKKLRHQFVTMKKIWDQRNRTNRRPTPLPQSQPVDNTLIPEVWEYALGGIANGCNEEYMPLQSELLADPGITIIRDLIFEFRASQIVSALKMTCRLLKLHIGTDPFNELLHDYCAVNDSELFGYANALRFGEFIESQTLSVPFLKELLDFELAAAQTFIDGQTRTLDLPFDPYRLLDDLVQWHTPQAVRSSPSIDTLYRVEIRPDTLENEKESWLKFNTVVHV